MASKVGTLIKKARTEAGLTQEELARKISGLSASDISKAERGDKDLTQEQLKRIAKATGVTQSSLLNAAKGKTASKTTKSSKTSKSSSTSKTTSTKLTAAEKKFIEAYRDASAAERKAALRVLQGKCADMVEQINDNDDGDGGELADFLGEALGALLGGK